MELKEIIDKVLSLNVWNFTVCDFSKNNNVSTNTHSVRFLSSNGELFFEIFHNHIEVMFDRKYRKHNLYLLKELKQKFPNHIIKQKIYD